MMDSNRNILQESRLTTQMRDLEILYRAIASYYWKGSVKVFASFQSLPRGTAVPDGTRIVFKQESFDVDENERYPLRLLVKSPDLSSLVAQRTEYPDHQATFFINPNANDTDCVILFYVFTTERDRRLCCPYSAGPSLLLMNTEVSQVLDQDMGSATDLLMSDILPFLPLHRAGFKKLEQSQLHGFLIMKEAYSSHEPERRDVLYWRTKGLDSQVQLTTNPNEATCCRYSPACSEAGAVARNPQARQELPPLKRTLTSPKYLIKPEIYHPTHSLKRSDSITENHSELYSLFVRDTALIWSAFYRYILGPGTHSSQQNVFKAYLTSNTLIPYYPPQGASQQDPQVPLDMRRSLRARTHNEIKDGFPSVVFVNPDTMALASNSRSPPNQAIYFLEFQQSGSVATPSYLLKSASERYLVVPSFQEETRNQHKTTMSENLAFKLDQPDTETAIEALVNTVLPNLLPKQDLENSFFKLHGTHEQFYLFHATPSKYYYWKARPETNAVTMTINSTEATLFQLKNSM